MEIKGRGRKKATIYIDFLQFFKNSTYIQFKPFWINVERFSIQHL